MARAASLGDRSDNADYKKKTFLWVDIKDEAAIVNTPKGIITWYINNMSMIFVSTKPSIDDDLIL